MSYVLSYANRFYTALETAYGQVAAITAVNRIPALKLTAQQQHETPTRKDKSGSRTFPGTPPGGRRRTTFELRTYLTTWQQTGTPAYGPLFQAALGGSPVNFAGGTVASYTSAGRLGFAAPHGLAAGQAVACGSEIRFVGAIVDASNVQLNAPFTVTPAAGAAVGAAVTYTPASSLPSATIFDYWDPSTAVQRMLQGASVDQMEILVNGDYHEVRFKGLAMDVVDSASFTAGTGASSLQSFPAEPAVAAFDHTIVPGNLGQAWLGPTATQFSTITSASVVVKNGLETRSHEFGSSLPKAIAPGERAVTAAVTLYSMDDANTQALYQAARQQSPISVMFQLGNAAGQLLGVYLKSVIPEVPEFDDSQNRLQWNFRSSRAQGTVNDEVMVAFA
jgi:hypothetical protein